MSDSTELDDLRERVEVVEAQIDRLTILAPQYKETAFTHYLLELKASSKQETLLYELIDGVDKEAADGKKADPVAFETRVGEILGRAHDPHQTASCIVMAFEEEGRFKDAVRALKDTFWLG